MADRVEGALRILRRAGCELAIQMNMVSAHAQWEAGYTTSRNFTEYENTPRAEWPTYPIPHDALLEAESAEFVDGVSEW